MSGSTNPTCGVLSSPSRMKGEKKRKAKGFVSLRKWAKRTLGLVGDEALDNAVGMESFRYFPLEVFMRICASLNIKDVLSLSLVCRQFYSLSESSDLWKDIARTLIQRGRRIDLHDEILLDDLSHQQLKKSVLMCVAAEHAWMSEVCKPTSYTSISTWRLAFNFDGVSLPELSSRYLLFSSSVDSKLQISCYDLERKRCNGLFKSRRIYRVGWFHQILINRGVAFSNAQSDHIVAASFDIVSNSMYCVEKRDVASYSSQLRIRLFKCGILQIKTQRGRFICSRIGSFLSFLPTGRLECQILSVAQRMLWIASRHPQPRKDITKITFEEETAIQVVLDWNAGLTQSCFISIPIRYEFGKTVVAVRLSSDDSFLVVHTSEDDGRERLRFFVLDELRAVTGNALRGGQFDPKFVSACQIVELSPIAPWQLGNTYRVRSGLVVKVETFPCCLPSRGDDAHLCSTSTILDRSFHDKEGSKWNFEIVQSYRRNDDYVNLSPDNASLRFGCCESCRCTNVVTLANIVTVKRYNTIRRYLPPEQFPLVGVSSSHAVWIEKGIDDSQEEHGWLSVKIVTFPDPCPALLDSSRNTPCLSRGAEHLRLRATTVTGIPQELLASAVRLDINVAKGVVIIGTSVARKWRSPTTDLHVFRFI